MGTDDAVPPWNGKTVLITGINGYIASTLGLFLLQRDYAVRGTIRDAKKARRLLDGAYAVYGDRFKLIVIPDMSVDGSLDQAVVGVNIIFHLASPVAFHLRVISEVVDSAVKLTESVLNAALHHAGPQLEAIVVTSSGAAMIRSYTDYKIVLGKILADVHIFRCQDRRRLLVMFLRKAIATYGQKT
jgi:nucleoside-diphosphate-sugar epimerase